MVRRVRPRPEFAQEVRLERKLREFEFPDLDTVGVGAQPSLTGGAPTVVIAASDATDISKQKADFVCNGSGDQAIFVTAADLIHSQADGGRILLTEGTFVFSGGVSVAGANLHIRGMGPASTVVQCTNTGFAAFQFNNGRGAQIGDLTLEGVSGTLTHALSFNITGVVDNVHFINWDVCIDLQSEGFSITRCTTDASNYFVDMSPFGSDAIITGNGLDGLGVAKIKLGASANNTIITNNIMQGGIETTTACDGVVIEGNTWEGVTASSGFAVINIAHDIRSLIIANNVMDDVPGIHGIRINGASNVQILGNRINGADTGILLQSSAHAQIIGNQLVDVTNGIVSTALLEDAIIADNLIEPGEFGIDATSAFQWCIADNFIFRPGLDTDNTYDGIILRSNSDENLIMGNYVHVWSSGNAPRYGINISVSTCDNNAVYANYLGATANYGTGDFNDVGTGTLTAPAANGQFVY